MITPTLERLDAFTPISLDEPPARALARVRDETAAFKTWFTAQGTVQALWTRSLVTLPYPRTYGLWEACSLPVPYVWMTNRVMVVRWRSDGRTVTLLAEPSDYELGVDTPYLRNSIERLPVSRERALDRLFVRHGELGDHLAELGIHPDEVDYLVFDHLHTQDVRRLIGTTAPAPDSATTTHPSRPSSPTPGSSSSAPSSTTSSRPTRSRRGSTSPAPTPTSTTTALR